MSVDPAKLRVVHYPDDALRRKAEPVSVPDPAVAAVAARMIELMHEEEGVGLAAPQVGLPWRLFVTNVRGHDDADRVFVNPVLTLARNGVEPGEEGCLSIPGLHVQVRRAIAARIEAHDLEGRPVSMEGEGFLARVWQHEFDHLEGVLIIDRMSPIDRLATRRFLEEMRATGT